MQSKERLGEAVLLRLKRCPQRCCVLGAQPQPQHHGHVVAQRRLRPVRSLGDIKGIDGVIGRSGETRHRHGRVLPQLHPFSGLCAQRAPHHQVIGLLRHQALAQVGAHGPAAGGGDGTPPLHVRAGAVPSPHQLRPQRGGAPARAGLRHRAVRARVGLLSVWPVLPQRPAVQNGSAEERLVVIDLGVE